MAAQASAPVAPAGLAWPVGELLRRVRVRLTAPRLDARLAAGERPSSDPSLACRATQLVSMRARRRMAGGLERLWTARRDRAVLSAAIPFDRNAVQLARPALEQLAIALRSRPSVDPRGVVLTQLLLTEPNSALYRPAYAEELCEVAREALFALGPGK